MASVSRENGKEAYMALSRRVRSISPSSTLALTALGKQMQAEGIDVISFAGGEPDFDTPKHARGGGVQATREGFTRYTAVAGTEQLRDAVVAKLKRDNGLEYARDEVIASAGSKQVLYNLAMVLFDKRDEIIIPVPYWVTYPEQVRLAAATPVFVSTAEEEGFRLKRRDVEGGLTPRTKALILNSPCNPTGAVIETEELKAIAELAVEREFYLVSDEAYETLTFDDIKHVSIASLGEEVKARTFVVGSVSKTYAMTGWRVGYAAGPKEVIKAMIDLQSHSTSAPTSISQKAAVAALLGSQEAGGRPISGVTTPASSRTASAWSRSGSGSSGWAGHWSSSDERCADRGRGPRLVLAGGPGGVGGA